MGKNVRVEKENRPQGQKYTKREEKQLCHLGAC